ncbi:MAG TPA: ABC transporter substrate-binding protein [Acidimicrobiales bacterium]|nr:ABC transporter substrate-binding protein [Acidimicrobiales bacterium]
MAGCGDDSGGSTGEAGGTTVPGATAAPSTTAQPVAGGKVSLMLAAETRGMDPVQVAGASGLGGEPVRMYAVYDALVLTDNKTNEVTPMVAESLTSSDNIVWTLKLRPNVKFNDGTPYDAEAVKFNWERHADPALRSTSAATVNGLSMEVVDASTLKITLKVENGSFPRVVASQLNWQASPTAVKAKGADYGKTPADIVGAGPFLLKEWVRDSRMVLTKNPTYWRSGQPYIDELEIRILSDETQRFNSLTTNEVDVTYLNTLPIQKQAKDAGITVQTVNGIGSNGFNFNMQKEPFDDARIRRAVRLAVDPVQLNQVTTDGLGEPITSWFTKTNPFYDAAGEFPKFDATEAQRLIDAWVTEKGKNLEFTIKSNDAPSTVKAAEFVAASLNKLQKVSVKTQTMPQAQSTTDLRNRNYEMIPYAYLGADPEPQWYETWHSKGTRNLTGFANTTVDAALVRARNAKDLAARKAEYASMQKLLIDDGIPMLLYQRSQTALSFKPNKVQDIAIWEDGGGIFLERLWIKK